MNADRRKRINELFSRLEEIGADIETLRDEEQEYFDNMPENMQSGEKGEAAQSAIDALESAVSECESARNSLEEATA